MNSELSHRVGAVMLTSTIQSLATAEKIVFIRSCEMARSFTALQGSPKNLLMEAESNL